MKKSWSYVLLVVCFSGDWLAWNSAEAAPPVVDSASLCWNAVIVNSETVGIVILPQLYGSGAQADSWSTIYYAVVSLRKDSAGHYPCGLYGPFPAGGNPRINGRSREIRDGSMYGNFFDETNVSYDLKKDGTLVRWQRIGTASDRTFRRSVLDTADHKWTDPKTVALTNGEKALSYNKRQSGEFIAADNRPAKDSAAAVYDTTTDKWIDDPWFSAVLRSLKSVDCERWVTTDDRNWVFADFYDAWLRDNKEQWGREPVEATIGGLRFDRRAKVLMFHRGDEKPTVLDRFKGARGPEHAFVDSLGEAWLWYEPSFTERNEVFTNIVLVSLHDKTSSVLERVNIDYDFLEVRNVLYFDAPHAALMAIRGDSHAVQADHDGAALPLTLHIFTWNYLDDRRNDVEIDLGGILTVRGGEIVPKEKPAVAISELGQK